MEDSSRTLDVLSRMFSDDAAILPRRGGHAQAGQFVYGRRGPLRISLGVPDHQLERSSGDPAFVIDVANGRLESSEQVPARLDPARPGQRNESADPDDTGRSSVVRRDAVGGHMERDSAAKAAPAQSARPLSNLQALRPRVIHR
jgi:hypothetical protein